MGRAVLVMQLLRRVLRPGGVRVRTSPQSRKPAPSGLLFVITEGDHVGTPSASPDAMRKARCDDALQSHRTQAKELFRVSANSLSNTHDAAQAEDARRSERQAKAIGVFYRRSIRQRAARRAASCEDDFTSFHRQKPEQARALRRCHTRAVSELLAQAALKLDPRGTTGTAHFASHATHHPPTLGRRAKAGLPTPDVVAPALTLPATTTHQQL